MEGWGLALLTAGCFAASALAVGASIPLLRRHRILDRPNARSSHSRPTPRGGGLGLLLALLPGWAAIGLWSEPAPAGLAFLLAAAAGLALVSWIDDLRTLPVALRLAAQAAAVGLGLAALHGAGPVFQGLLPLWLDRLSAALLWLWFLNLYNFMDGIDGLAGLETAAIGGGLAAVALLAGWPPPLAALGLALAAAALGFLLWNRPPARIFLGDVGSIPLGYLAGWLLLAAAAEGAWAVALILPAYFLADATLTLLGRLKAGKSVLEAHAEHAYQRAARARGHAAVIGMVLLANLVLIGLAVGAARGEPLAALLGAGATVALLLRRLVRAAAPARR